jgi:hypothetical protein
MWDEKWVVETVRIVPWGKFVWTQAAEMFWIIVTGLMQDFV